MRQFGIRVSVIEPGFTRTNIGQNGQLAGRPLVAYASKRNRVLEAIREGIAHGDDPVTVAAVVLEALTSRSPRLRYPAAGGQISQPPEEICSFQAFRQGPSQTVQTGRRMRNRATEINPH